MNKKTKTVTVQKGKTKDKLSEKLKAKGLVRITLDLTIATHDRISELNDGYMYTSNDQFKPFLTLLLNSLSNHKDRKRICSEIMNRNKPI